MQKSGIFALVLGAHTLGLSFAVNAQTLTLKWEVENRFRFYRNATTFQYYAAAAKQALPGNRENWILSTERQLQTLYSSSLRNHTPFFPEIKRQERDPYDWNGWASLTRDETCWDRNSYHRIQDGRCADYISPVTHTVVVTASGAATGARCQWTITTSATSPTGQEDVWKQRMKLNADLMAKQPPCGQPVEVEVPWASDGSASADVAVKVVGGVPQAAGPTNIAVKDILVIGMGDSFGAGVGNPDKPAQMDWGNAITYQPFALSGREKTVPVRNGGNADGVMPTSAVYKAQGEWQDIRCFRSQYGPQFRTALHMAVLMEQTAITYLDLSCNGARIIEGLLNEKSIDSGYRWGTTRPPAQLGVASQLLCASQSKWANVQYTLHAAQTDEDCRNLGTREICEFAKSRGQIATEYQDIPGLTRTSMQVCNKAGPKPFVRNVDLLLLSIGGNDIGFAPMVGDVIIDDQGAADLVKQLGTLIGSIHTGATGMQRLGVLKSKYDVLDRAISEFLPIRPGATKPIFISAYPLPIDDASGRLCGSLEDNDAANAALNINSVFSQFGSAQKKARSRHDTPLSRLRSVARTTCALALRRMAWFDDGAEAQTTVGELTGNTAMCSGQASEAQTAPNVTNLHWQYIPEILTTFRGHGFCALADREAAGVIPEYTRGGISNNPWDPDFEHMQPYKSRERWVRSPNDAFVVTNWLSGTYNLDGFLNLMSAATTSAMHPTAEGNAATADALLGRVTTFVCTERKAEFSQEPLCRAP
jgi:hypothetical protein